MKARKNDPIFSRDGRQIVAFWNRAKDLGDDGSILVAKPPEHPDGHREVVEIRLLYTGPEFSCWQVDRQVSAPDWEAMPMFRSAEKDDHLFHYEATNLVRDILERRELLLNQQRFHLPVENLESADHSPVASEPDSRAGRPERDVLADRSSRARTAV